MSPTGDVKHIRATTNHIPNTGTLVLNPLHLLLGCVKEGIYTHTHTNLSIAVSLMNSKSAFKVFLNTLKLKCCPAFAMRLIIVLICVKLPMVFTLKSNKWQTNYETTIICCTDFITVQILFQEIFKQC
jgi:hypothetical protein